MPGKKVILCEGIHDAIFLELLIRNRGTYCEIITKEQLQNPRQRSPETNCIKQFLCPKKAKLKFLLKDEGGNIKSIMSFAYLYEDKDERFLMILCLDRSPKNLEYLRQITTERFKQDLILKVNEHSFLTKDRFKHRIFFVPKSLEFQVRTIIGKSIDGKTHDELYEILDSFILKCRELKIPWFSELETLLFEKEI